MASENWYPAPQQTPQGAAAEAAPGGSVAPPGYQSWSATAPASGAWPPQPAAEWRTREDSDAGEPSQQRASQSWFKRKFGPVLAAIAALFAKLKAILLLLPKLKLLTTVGTMLVSVAAYSVLFGWTFAAGFVLLILVHEMGHVIALRREGIRASAPVFIPFLGAVIGARSLGDNALAEARVGLAGPILGSIGSAVCILIWHATGDNFWRALAFTGLFLNLFNLLPVVPLDGGRAMAAMAPWMWFVGFAALIPLAFIFPNPVIFLVLLIGGYETYKRWKMRQAGGEQQHAYYRVRPRDRALIAAVYVGLIALLVIGMHATTLKATFG